MEKSIVMYGICCYFFNSPPTVPAMLPHLPGNAGSPIIAVISALFLLLLLL